MRVLVLHSKYLSEQTSGETRVVEDETRLLRQAGHDVQFWMPSPTELSPRGLARIGVGAMWSREAVREVRRRIRLQGTEVVHCHNLFPMLSPAVLSAAAAERTSVVMTLHNYRLLCLPATFLRDGRVCEDCLGRLPWRGVVHRCYRGSALGSGALAGAVGLHRALHTFDRVRLYLAVSGFVRDKYIQAGFSAERIAVKPNFVHPVPRRNGPGEYFVFLGRLAAEKGVATLLEACRQSRARVVIAGDGPERPLLRDTPASVAYRGNLPPEEVPALLASARALLFPAQSYEGAPRVVLEAYAAGVPVLASRIGGLPALVEEGDSGLLIPSDDPTAWARAIERLADDSEAERMGEGAWQLWRAHYSPERGLQNLEAAYRASLEPFSHTRSLATA
jgi:glycosyltransferase involved in cell wall biosynthesis